MNEASVEEAIASLDAIEVPPSRSGGAAVDYGVFDWADDVKDAIDRLVAAVAGKPVHTEFAVSTGGWNSGLKTVCCAPWDASAMDAHWQAVAAQEQIRIYLARGLVAALRAGEKLALAQTNPWGAARAAYDLVGAITRLIESLKQS